MAAAKRNRKKGRKRPNIFNLFGACFGASKSVSAEGEAGKNSCCQSRKTIPIDYHKLASTADEIVSCSGKEIVHHAVEAEEEKGTSQMIVSQSAHQVIIDDKRNDDKIVPVADKQIISSLVEPGRAIRHESSLSLPSALNTQLESRRNSIKQLPRPVSLPVDLRGQSSSNQKKGPPAPALEPSPTRGFDPILGALVLTTTLIVMLIWGKICALICMAAWFFFIHRLMTKNSTNRTPHHHHHLIKPVENGSSKIDMDSWEYKKMVVLQGLLSRKHRPYRFQ